MPSKRPMSEALLQQLTRTLEVDAEQRAAMIGRIKGVVVFVIDGAQWTLDLREGRGTMVQGPPMTKADITLTLSDGDFLKLVTGKIGPQHAFLMRKLKISGSMALALKLQPILDAVAPKAKL